MTVSTGDKDLVDVLILGGGPAGISALLWAADLGMSAKLLERGRPGGQLYQIHNPITNYPGLNTSDGAEMAARFLKSVNGLSDSIVAPAEITSFDSRSITAATVGGETYAGRTAIIATGVSRRRLYIPGEAEFLGRGVLESGARQKHEVAGKRVVIIGGGDAALENALILSDFADKVFVAHRRGKFSARDEFVSRAEARDNVEFLFDTTVASINGDDGVRSVTLRSGPNKHAIDLSVDLVLIRIGVEPNSKLFADEIILDDRGYIIVDALGRTNVPNIFAAGDVANPGSPTLSTATGTAATSAKTIYSLIYGQTRL